jgi:hypothetical protein
MLICAIAVLSAAEERYALVIGNSAYANSPLQNPVNDATAMSRALTNLGFKVTPAYNVPTYQQMVKLIRDFGQQLQKGGVGLFYYAGHGVQIDGRNYLIPTQADIRKEGDVELEAVDLDRVLNEMQYARNEVNIIILDACRDNPYSTKFRSSARGLASITKPVPDCLIAYATQPNGVARDGDGENGIFTEELLRAMETPGLSLTQVMMQVRTNVKKRTNDEQLPWENSLLTRDFYFKEAAPKPVEVAQPKGPETTPAPVTKPATDPNPLITSIFQPTSTLVTATDTPQPPAQNRTPKVVVHDQPKRSLFNLQFNLGVDFPGSHTLEDGITTVELSSGFGGWGSVEALLDFDNIMLGIGLEYAMARKVWDDTDFYAFTSDVSFLPIYLAGKLKLPMGSKLSGEFFINLGLSTFTGNEDYEWNWDELRPGAFLSLGAGMSVGHFVFNLQYKVNTGIAHDPGYLDFTVTNGQAGIGIGYRLH